MDIGTNRHAHVQNVFHAQSVCAYMYSQDYTLQQAPLLTTLMTLSGQKLDMSLENKEKKVFTMHKYTESWNYCLGLPLGAVGTIVKLLKLS